MTLLCDPAVTLLPCPAPRAAAWRAAPGWDTAGTSQSLLWLGGDPGRAVLPVGVVGAGCCARLESSCPHSMGLGAGGWNGHPSERSALRRALHRAQDPPRAADTTRPVLRGHCHLTCTITRHGAALGSGIWGRRSPNSHGPGGQSRTCTPPLCLEMALIITPVTLHRISSLNHQILTSEV